MSLKIAVKAIGGVVVRHAHSTPSFSYLTMMSPSEADEQRYCPAESVQAVFSNAQLKEFGEWLIELSKIGEG